MSTAGDEGVRYRNKVTIVSGGSRGIGQGCVELFVRHGSKVVFGDIREDIGKELEETINKAGHAGEALFVRCDVTNEEDIKNLVQTAIDKYGRIDCLINNAGTTRGLQTIDTATAEGFRKLHDLNVIGFFLLAKYALPHIRNVKGTVINMSSMSGVLGEGLQLAYASTKAAILGLTQSMAIDEANFGVRVNSLSPGAIHTPLWTEAMKTFENPERKHQLAAEHGQYMGRMGTAEEVAKACLFLATDATFTTGANIQVAGGQDVGLGLKFQLDKLLD